MNDQQVPTHTITGDMYNTCKVGVTYILNKTGNWYIQLDPTYFAISGIKHGRQGLIVTINSNQQMIITLCLLLVVLRSVCRRKSPV